MEKYSLIGQLDETQETPEPKLPPGIKYQQYEILVEGKEMVVNIPLRETATFEQILSEYETIDREQMNEVLRHVRGIRD